MKQFLVTVAGVFVGLLLFFIGLPVVLLASAVAGAQPAVPGKAVLSLDLRQNLTDQDPSNPFALFGGTGLSTLTVVETLRAAETDPKIKALFVRLPEGGMTPAAAEELRLAFKRFRAANKPVVVHSQGLYQSGTVASTYALAASASEIWMPTAASFQVTGLATSELFLARAFERYGVQAQYEQRYEYKNAANPYLQADFTPAHREATLSWMTSVYENAIAQAAADRRKQPAALRAALEAGPFLSEQARAQGLIDRIGQVEEAEDAILKRAGANAELMDFAEYASARAAARPQTGDAIAIVGGEGPIMTGAGDGGDPFGGGQTMWSDEIAEAFYDAIEDDSVKAIVFRVSSPGGSDVASEQIGAALRAAKAAGKPVVVSMGEYAASGGYWVSADASAIVAHPSTLTGSIGVFVGKFAFGDALARFGVDSRDLTVGGAYAGAFSSSQGFSPEQRAAVGRWADGIYEAFVQRVANGRKIAPERVREIARGRVWTGSQAKELGLVDELGGLYEAVARAKALAGIDADKDVRLKRFPEAKSPFEAFASAFGASADGVKALAAMAWVMGDPRAEAVLDEMAESRMRERGATVLTTEPLLR